MAEPNATIATGAGLALGTVTLTGTILGMHYDALLIGFFAALVALLHLPAPGGDPRWWCRVVVWLLDSIQPGHCTEAARREGLLK